MNASSVAELSTEILQFQLACLRVAGPILAGLGAALVLIVTTIVVNMAMTLLPSQAISSRRSRSR